VGARWAVQRGDPYEHSAEAQLADYKIRVETLKIRDLDLRERQRYLREWLERQSRFVDYPKGTVTAADELLCSVMQTRGYAVDDFDHLEADIAVYHPKVVGNYRAAHEIALRLSGDEASTEELRTALIHFRSLFDEVVQTRMAHESYIRALGVLISAAVPASSR
jgi:hypothetical protein